MKVSAIIVTYNRINILKGCIKHLLSQNYKLNNIIIINNNSTDGTYKYLQNLNNKKIIIKNMEKNVGGSGGFSAGLKLAFEKTDSELFWIMDDDTYPTTSALSNLIISANKLNNKFGFLCSNIRWWKDNRCCNAPTVEQNWSQLLPGNLIKVKIATFVSFMISRSTVAKLGLPVRQMFIWGDDVDYSLRLHKYFPCYYVSNSIVINQSQSSPTSSLFNMPRSREKYLEYSFRNELYAYRKNEGFIQMMKKILADISFILRIPFYAKHDKLHKLYYTIWGLIKGFFFNPKIEFPKRNY